MPTILNNFVVDEKGLISQLDKIDFVDLSEADSENVANVQATSLTQEPTSKERSPADSLESIDSITFSSIFVDNKVEIQAPVNLSTKNRQKPDLIIRLEEINLPDTMDMGDRGKVQIIVKNQGNALAAGRVRIDLYLSTDKAIDANDALLKSFVKKIHLQPGQSDTYKIKYSNNPSAIAAGSYQIIAQVDADNTIDERKENNNIDSKWCSSPGTDMVIDWQSIALNAIQAEGVAGRGIPPTGGSRLMAMLSTAIYDTVNAFEQIYTPYLVDTNAPENASEQAAVVGAAYGILSALIPQQIAVFNEEKAHSLKEIRDRRDAETVGFDFGYNIARQTLASRANDGSDNNTPYTPPQGDYVWHPDPPNFVAVGPNWGGVTPFSTADLLERFPLDGLDGTPDKDAKLYARDIEEVRKYGGKESTDVTTILRTPEQTEIAIFWASDRPDTFRPYGHLVQIAADIAVKEDNTLAENARLFAALNTALADTGIVIWNAKYIYNQPRPDDAIAGGITLNDGRKDTLHDPNWKPLLPTPPFPDYPSGHSSFGGAWAGVMTHFFGENYKFKAMSQEMLGITRQFDNFYDAAYEDAISRVYGGVHVREATVTDSLPVGLDIGTFVAENLFQPVI